MNGSRLLWLKVAVAVMSVLIVAGVAVVAVTIVRRAGGPFATTASILLHEPEGTRIASVTAAGDRLVVQLAGGGPDRVSVLDLRDGRVLLLVTLAP